MMKLYLFDFDGTITRRDSLFRFLIFSKGWAGFFVRLPRVAFRFFGLFVSKKWSNEAAKAVLLDTFFHGFLQRDLEKMGRDFCEKALPPILKIDVFEKAKRARAEKNMVVVVSASCDVWLRPFCEKHGFELISTEFDYKNGRFTGFFKMPNCNGAEKRRRIEAFFSKEELADFEKIIAFGNSAGDAAMLEMADEKNWV